MRSSTRLPIIGGISGSFPSAKLGQPIIYRSTIERDALFFWEFDQDVQRYQPWPAPITGATPDGGYHSYTPAFQVTRTGGRELVACMPAALVETPTNRRNLALAEEWAAAHGHTVTLITDAIRAGHQLANLRLLWRYRSHPVPHASIASIIDHLAAHPSGVPMARLATVVAGSAAPPTAYPCLYHLLFHHLLLADLDQPIGPASLLWLPQAA